jgi:3-keto-disaccharide hydrolase
MTSRSFVLRAALLAVSAIVAMIASTSAQQNPYLGRWNLTPTGDNTGVYWLEIKEDGGKLTGMFLNRGGHPLPLATVKVENGELFFEKAPDQQGPSPQYRARINGDKLAGTIKSPARTIEFVGTRPPKWPAANANAPHKFGKPIALFDGKSMDAWDVQTKGKPMGWTVVDGTMTNTPHANNLVSKQKFQDYKIHAEYKLEQNSNSGIYIRGRYELQVLDDYGKPPFERGHMSVYGWHTPRVNASKPIGEWQTMEATIVANKVTVVLNGQKVQDNVTLEAITGGALDANEAEPGPVMIQGDHEKVTYRNVTVTPILDARNKT